MKILHTVEYYFPSVGGAQEVVRQISERLTKRGHEVTVATTYLSSREKHNINGVIIEDFSISGNAVRGFSGDTTNYQKFLQDSNFDIIMNYAAQQWTTDLMLPIMDKIPGKKVLVPCGYSGLFSSAYQDYYRNMKQWIKSYDACVYLSNNYRDINFARECGANNGIIIPNGASEEEFLKEPQLNIRSYLGIPQNHFLILLVGSHTGLKGHKEAIKIFKEAKLSHSTLLIVAPIKNGGCFKSCKRAELYCNYNPILKYHDKKIIISQLSREQTVAAFKTANLFLFPSNVECSPIVLFECMASRTPFLTTDVGNTPEIINWSNSGILLPTEHKDSYSYARVKESAKQLEEIYYNANLRRNMSESGYYNWQKCFTWEKIAEGYERLYFALMNSIPLEKLRSEEPCSYWNQIKGE
ncbi:MAG TPA: glycosyltransferase family 4 protein [Methanosarcina sp.]|nr:glycosyltransferase family 4 protein [Methanosarcina sp.]